MTSVGEENFLDTSLVKLFLAKVRIFPGVFDLMFLTFLSKQKIREGRAGVLVL